MKPLWQLDSSEPILGDHRNVAHAPKAVANLYYDEGIEGEGMMWVSKTLHESNLKRDRQEASID